MKKYVLFGFFACMANTVLAQPPNSSSGSSINTPAATGGATYDGDVVSGLDEYNQRKKALQEKAEKVRQEQKRLAEDEYRRKLAEATREQQEKETVKLKNNKNSNTKQPKVPTNNSNQDYFDRQTKIMEQNK